MKNKLSLSKIIITTLLISICLFDLFLLNTTENSNYLILMKIQVFVIYIYITYTTLKNIGILSLQFLFLLTLGLFSLGGIFLSLLGLTDLIIGETNQLWSYHSTMCVLFYYLIFLTIYFCVVINFKFKNNPKSIVRHSIAERDMYKDSNLWFYCGRILMICSFPFALALAVLEYQTVMKSGYTGVYLGALSNVQGASILSLFRLSFTTGYAAICCSRPDLNKFTKYSSLFGIIAFIHTLQGARGAFVVFICYFLYYRYIFYGVKPKNITIIILGICAIPILQYFSYIRMGRTYNSDVFNSIINFIKSTGSSVNVLVAYMENKEALSFNKYPYILDPIVRLYQVLKYPSVFNLGQSQAMIAIRYNLNHQLTYYLAPGVYLSGGGMGSNFIAELSEFGTLGVISGAFALTLFIRWYSNKIYSTEFFRFISYSMTTHILMLPRKEYFYDTYNLFKLIVVYMGMKAIISFLKKRHYFSKKDLTTEH